MKIQHSSLGGLAIFVGLLLFSAPQVYAQDMSQFNTYIERLHAHRIVMEKKLGLIPAEDLYKHASSYYDDQVERDEQGQLMRDVIAEGI